MGKWAKYSKKYKKQWENEEELKGWLIPLAGDDTKAACKFCHNTLRAHHSDLLSHAGTVKHIRNSGLGDVVKKEGKKVRKRTKSKSTKQKKIELSDIFALKDTEIVETKVCPDEVVNPANLGFIGSGNIAQALLSTFLKEGLVDPHLVIASSPSDNNLSKLRAMGVRTTHDNNEVVHNCDLVFICVQSHVLSEMICDLLPLEDHQSPLFVSVMTGVSLATLEEMLSSIVDNPRVVRTIPNIPSGVRQGCSLFTRGTHTSPSDAEVMRSMLESTGFCDEMPEHHMDAASGIVCSTPAFIFMAIEALADGAVKMGLPRQIAQTLAAQTVKSAATMVVDSGKHPAELKDDSCLSNKGTINAVHILEKYAFRNALMSAVEASSSTNTQQNLPNNVQLRVME